MWIKNHNPSLSVIREFALYKQNLVEIQMILNATQTFIRTEISRHLQGYIHRSLLLVQNSYIGGSSDEVGLKSRFKGGDDESR